MSQTNEPNQSRQQSQPTGPNAPNQPQQSQTGQPKRGGGLRTLGIIGLVLVAILSLGFAGYSTMNPHTMTYTQQQLVTNTQTVFNTQTVVSTSTNLVTTMQTVTHTTTTGYPNGYSQYYAQNCPAWGCGGPPPYSPNYYYYDQYYYYYSNPYYPYYYSSYQGYQPPCQTVTAYNNTVTCSGYLYQDPNQCTVLVIPIYSPYQYNVYQYYTLQNAPPNLPSMGTWVTVAGQLHQGANTSPTGASCPGNYIIVTSLTH
jgi:hypothetical protein